MLSALIVSTALAIVAADAPKGNDLPSVTETSELKMDQVMSFFQRGIVKPKPHPDHGTPKQPPHHNRIYTVGELENKFGVPDSRTNYHGGGSKSTANHNGEHWVYRCKDGTVTVSFLTVGYAGKEDAKGKDLRLELLKFDQDRGDANAAKKHPK
jgi:hypothetical protein